MYSTYGVDQYTEKCVMANDHMACNIFEPALKNYQNFETTLVEDDFCAE